MTLTLTITRGLPGSGKTTWALDQTWAVRVNRDDLRSMMYRDYRGPLQPLREKRVTHAETAAVEALLVGGQSVVVDNMNLADKYAGRWKSIAGKHRAVFVVKDFTDVPLHECIRRDAARAEYQRVGEKFIRDCHARWLKGRPVPLPLPVGAEPEPPPTPVRYEPDLSKPAAMLVDIDGTIALRGSRNAHDLTTVGFDQVNWPVFLAMVALRNTYKLEVVFMSGRSEVCRADTEKWFADQFGLLYADEPPPLFMRPAGDGRKDAIIKAELFDKHIRDEYNVMFVLDDRDSVIRLWRDMGLTAFQVADGDF